MLQNIPPSLGRALIRQTADGYITVGVMHFDPSYDFVPIEGAAYPLLLDGVGLEVGDELLDDNRMPGYDIDQLSDWALQPRWRSSSYELGTLMHVHFVRFTKAFENGFSFISVSKNDPFNGYAQAHTPSQSHYMIDIHNGHLTRHTEHAQGNTGQGFNGMALSSILTAHCIWPNAQGELHTLPNLTLAAREKFQKLRSIDEQVILGLISREDAGLQRINMGETATPPVLQDDKYRSYYELLMQYGMTTPSAGGPLNLEDHNRLEQFAKLAVSAVMEGDTESLHLHQQLQEISGLPRTPLQYYTVQAVQKSSPSCAPSTSF